MDIVVVTYNSRAHIGACLDSIAAADFDGGVHSIVVDNASSDGTVDAVKDRPGAAQLIENASNRGFAAACNQGIRATSSELVLLLNPDACLQPATLRRLVDYLIGHPRVAIVGPRLLQASGGLQPDISATGLFPSFRQAIFEYTRLGRLFPQNHWYRDYFLTDWDRLSNRPVAMVQGACLLLRRAVAQEVGFLDERFFLYFEETDLCKNVADRGWEIHYVSDAAAVHVGSQSMPGRRQSARHFIASLYRFHRKHYGTVEAVALWSVLMPYHGLRVLRLGALLPFKPADRQLRADLGTAWCRFIAHFGIDSSKSVLGIILGAGLVLRLLLCWVPGYEGDQAGWGALARNATTNGVAHAYGLPANDPRLGVYPPLYHAVLAVVGHVYQQLSPNFELATPTLNRLLKLPPLLGDGLLMLLLSAAVRRSSTASASLAVAIGFALNPAIIFNSAYWGMFGDSLFTACVVAALVAIQRERPGLAWVAITTGLFFKPQSAVFIPLVAWMTLRPVSVQRWGRLGLVCAVTAASIWWPFFLAGTLPEAVATLRHTTSLFPVLSMNAHNFWYLLSWGHSRSSDVSAVASILTARSMGLAMFAAAYIVALTQLQSRHDSLLMLTAAYIGFAFFMLCTQMHENYSYPSIVLLIAAAPLSAMGKVLAVVLSATALANMALHDPLFDSSGWLSSATVNRLALLNSAINVLVFVLWTGAMLHRTRFGRPRLIDR